MSCTGWFRQASVMNTTIAHPSGGTQGAWFLVNRQTLTWSVAEMWDQSMAARFRATDTLVSDTNVWVFMAMTWDNSTETLTLYVGINGGALNSTVVSEAGSCNPISNIERRPNIISTEYLRTLVVSLLFSCQYSCED